MSFNFQTDKKLKITNQITNFEIDFKSNQIAKKLFIIIQFNHQIKSKRPLG
jgi:hypothetical protein